MLDAIGRIRRYTVGLSFSEFQSDRKTVDAVLYNFAVIGEAARHVPLEIESAYPLDPLSDMRAMRNVIIHDYPGVDLRVVWDTVMGDLPALVPILDSILDNAPDTDA